MTTFKPQQPLLHAPADDGRTPDFNSHRPDGCAPPDGLADAGDCIARVTAVDRDQYLIRDATREVPARLTGRVAYASASPADLPCVGDWVRVQTHDTDAGADMHASILGVLPRRSFLRRKRPGDTVEFQMIAANIDVAFIVQSCHFDFNVRRLERYLVIAREGRIEPVILLTKTDLVSPEALEELLAQIRRAGIDTRVVTLSNVDGSGIEQLQALIEPGKTYCLLGSSGVGKTTLVNRLRGAADLATKAVSLSGEGRHTTTRRQLLVLEHGGLLIDMPGMRELGMLGVSEGIDDSFADVQAQARHCRFADCTHSGEPGCAVQRAIEQGTLDPAHFQSYLKLKRESAFHDLSHQEKRQKDRAFGKRVRSVTRTKAKGRRGDD